MTLIPNHTIDLNRCSQNTVSRKQYILSFLESSLDEKQISYYAYCINRLNAIRSYNAQNYKSHNEVKIDRENIECEEVSYSEREIKCFIILENSSIFSPNEYKQLYDKYIGKKKELKQVI